MRLARVCCALLLRMRRSSISITAAASRPAVNLIYRLGLLRRPYRGDWRRFLPRASALYGGRYFAIRWAGAGRFHARCRVGAGVAAPDEQLACTMAAAMTLSRR